MKHQITNKAITSGTDENTTSETAITTTSNINPSPKSTSRV